MVTKNRCNGAAHPAWGAGVVTMATNDINQPIGPVCQKGRPAQSCVRGELGIGGYIPYKVIQTLQIISLEHLFEVSTSMILNPLVT